MFSCLFAVHLRIVRQIQRFTVFGWEKETGFAFLSIFSLFHTSWWHFNERPFLSKKETFVSCHVNTVIFFAAKVYISYICSKFSSAFFSVSPDISSCLSALYSFHAMWNTFSTACITELYKFISRNVSFLLRKGHFSFSGVWETWGCVFPFSIGCDTGDSDFRWQPDGMSLSFLLCLGFRSIRSYMPSTAVSTFRLLIRER